MAFRALLDRSRLLETGPTKLNPITEYQQQRAVASMQPLAPVFQRLELSAYTEIFQENGFDMWDDVLDITENDLEQLNVLRGHRRRLQREIANFKGVPIDQIINSPGRAGSLEAGDNATLNNRSEGGQSSSTGKRRYRRHPKPDANAPERPPSAYVLFSNKIRDELKSENLSFTEMAKVVGEKWQQLDTDGREPFESEANDMKDTYNAKKTEYKKTDDWKEYQEYLANFKAAQQAAAQQGPEGKRVKLERSGDGSHNSSRGSQGTPTTSAQGSPINVTQPLINGNAQDGPSVGHSIGSHGAYPAGFSQSSGRVGPMPAIRPPVIGQALEPHPGPYAPQQQLPPITTDRPLPRRSQNQPPSLLGRAQDATSQMSSTSSGVYSPHTPVDSGPRSNSATSAETSTPYAQHHGVKSLSLAGRDSPVYSHTNASPVHSSYPGPDPSSRTLPPLPQQPPPPQRMDGLDALALASRIIDSNQDGRNLRGPPG